MRYTVIIKRKENDGRVHSYNINSENQITENEEEFLTFRSVNGAVNWTQSEDAFSWLETGECQFEVMELD